MSLQLEAQRERELVDQLETLQYEAVYIPDEESLLINLEQQLEKFNQTIFSYKEFDQIANHLAKVNVFDKVHSLRIDFY